MDFFKELIRAARRKPEINQDSNIPTPEIKEYVVSILDEVNEDVELVNRTVNAGTYFYSLNKLIDELRELSQYEKYRFFQNSTPSEDCRKILKPENLQHNADMLITRALRYCMSELRFLTAETAREGYYKRFVAGIRDAFEQSHTFWAGKDYPHYDGPLFMRANMDRVQQLCNEWESGYRPVMERVGDDWKSPSDFHDMIPQRLHDGQYILVSKPPSTAETIEYRKAEEAWLESYYDLNTAEGIQAIPEIANPPKWPGCGAMDVTGDIDYYLRFKSGEHEKAGRIDLAILCLRKSNAIRMVRPNLGYRKSDYYRLVKTLAFYGRVDEAYAEKEKIDRYFEKKAAESAPNEIKRVLEWAEMLKTDLVVMSCHGCVCSECAKYQGRVFSLTGKDRRFPKIPDVFFKYGGIHEGCSHTFSPCYGDTDALFYNNTLRYYPTIKKKYQKDIIAFSNRPFVDDRPPEDIEKAVEVREKAELRWERESKLLTAEYVIEREVKRGQDMRDFQWIQDNLPDICPKSLTGYRRMKNQNTKNYRKIVEAARAMGYEII